MHSEVSFFLRAAEPRDVTAIGKIHARSWQSTYKGILADSYLAKQDPVRRAQQALERFGKSEIKMFVAEMDGEVVGFMDFGKSRDPRMAESELHAIYILESAQRRGLGALLFEECVKACRTQGSQSLFVSVLSANTRAVSFYRKMGGKLVGHDRVVIEGVSYPTDTFFWPL